MANLEEALDGYRDHSDQAEELFHKHKSVRDHLEDEYYEWVATNCPEYTDHGRKHVDSVIHKAGELLADQLDNPVEGPLTEVDIFVLLSAIIWHDVGMVIDRADHETAVKDITEEVKAMGFPNAGVRRIVENVVAGHRNAQGLTIPNKERICTVGTKDFTIYSRSLSAVLRFADEISETHARVPENQHVLDNIPEESRIYWEFVKCINGTKVDLPRSRIIVNIDVEEEQAVEKHLCPKRWQDRIENEEVSLIEYIVFRLEKMNNEKMYCATEFKRYADIREIEARLTLLDESRSETKNLTETLRDSGLHPGESYPETLIFEEFFEKNSEWKPKKIQAAGD